MRLLFCWSLMLWRFTCTQAAVGGCGVRGDMHYGAETLYYTAAVVGVVHLKSLLYSQGDVRLPARPRQLLKEKATLALSRCITHRAMSLSAGGCRCVFGKPHYINFLPLVILSTRVSQRCVLLEFVNKSLRADRGPNLSPREWLS